MTSSSRGRRILSVAVGSVLLGAAVGAGAGDENRWTAPATPGQIVTLIDDLSHPAYEKRTFATRRLCAIGMPAREKLLAAAEGDNVETALRAKAVLAVLDRLMFTGVEVRLAFARTTLAWDEPADLNVTMTNRSKYPARVPFEIENANRTADADDARQVGDMLDLADLVHVRNAEGREIELTVDDITADPAVVAAVQERLGDGPSAVLDAGRQVTITARAFNRGWARFRLLDKGTYTVVLEYVPAWNDEALAAHRVGRVVSNQATVTITESAPATISQSGPEVSLALQRDGDFVAASLTNRTDMAMLVNKNFGRSAPFAQGRWVWESEGRDCEVPLVAGPAASWHDFDRALLVELAPGQSVEVARIRAEALRRDLLKTGADLGNRAWTVHFAYSSPCNRQWQNRQGGALLGNPKAPPFFQQPLPRHILSTRCTSNHLTAADLE